MDANLVNALTDYFPQLLPELVLGVAACVLFLGGTWRASRCLWGWTALISFALAGWGLWHSSRTVPTVESSAAEVKQLSARYAATSKALRSEPRDSAHARDLAEEHTAAGQELEKKVGAFNSRQYAAPVLHTRLAIFVRWLAILIGMVLVLFAWDEVPAGYAAEYHACLLLIVAGTGLTAAANDLITLFLALELVSIPTYLLLYLPRVDGAAQEAALKYFLLSIFSSSLLLFGFSYLYGLGGTTNLGGLADALGAKADHPLGVPRGVLLLALVMILAALGFRIAAVPFHFYAPDVYEGTATPNAAMLAVIPKVAGFIAMVRVLLLVPPAAILNVGQPVQTFGTPGYDTQIPVVLWIMAAVTMSLGNVLALLQDNIKRLLAYSSVAHAGYMLIGLTAAARLAGRGEVAVGGVEGVLFYLVAYGSMTIGAFALLTHLSTANHQVEKVDDLAGLGRNRPGSALLMTLFLLSLIGMPLTAGFAGKLFLFFGAMQTPFSLFSAKDVTALEEHKFFNYLVLIGAVNAAIGGWYYLRLIATMYLRDSAKPPAAPEKPRPVLAAVWVCAIVTVFVGVYPKPLLETIKSVVRIVPEVKADETAATALR